MKKNDFAIKSHKMRLIKVCKIIVCKNGAQLSILVTFNKD